MSRQNRLNKSMDTLFPQSAPDECRVCEEDVVDGRWNYCSERCREIANAVQRMFIWDTVREQVLNRDDYTCQTCGLSKAMWEAAYWHIEDIISEQADGLDERVRLQERYNWEFPKYHVDHIERIADGGHPFAESNLQTLCKYCHHEKTAEENSTETNESRPEISLEEYMEV